MNLKPKKHRITTGSFPASRLKIDPEVQRVCGFSPVHVTRIRNEWSPNAAGRITISKRADGTLVVIDGMHRLQAAPDGYVFRCDVHEGLTFEEECDLFRRLNQAKRVSAFDDFDKGVKAGDPECVAVNEIVEQHGLRVSNTHSDGTVAAVSALRDVYRKGGTAALDRALGIAVGAWGKRSESTDGQIIAGLGKITGAFNGELDDAALVKKLSKYPGGPTALIGSARGLRSLRPGSVATHVATIVLDVYNHGRRHKVGQ
jgi:hypothetical protein